MSQCGVGKRDDEALHTDQAFPLNGGGISHEVMPLACWTMESFSASHGCADSHQMDTVGASQDESSSDPALSHDNPGVAAAVETIGEPQALQKCLETGKPLLPVSAYVARTPASKASVPSTSATRIENELPVCRWQFLQLQITVRTGLDSDVYRIAPQRQPPEMRFGSRFIRVAEWSICR